MTARVDERIKVGVVFREEGQKMEPKWFSWRGRHLKITKTTYAWRERDGRDVIHKMTSMNFHGGKGVFTYLALS
jgi:hypothetical protein